MDFGPFGQGEGIVETNVKMADGVSRFWHEIASTQFAVDGEIEQCPISQATVLSSMNRIA